MSSDVASACVEICVDSNQPRYRVQDGSWPNHKNKKIVLHQKLRKLELYKVNLSKFSKKIPKIFLLFVA